MRIVQINQRKIIYYVLSFIIHYIIKLLYILSYIILID